MTHAFAEQQALIESHAHLIPRLARRLKRRLPSADVQELEGAGYLALVKAARAYRGENGCKFGTYFYECASGAMTRSFARPDGRKSTRHQLFVQLQLLVEASEVGGGELLMPDGAAVRLLAEHVASPGESPHQFAERNELRRRVARAFAMLRAPHAEIIREHYVEEVALAEIARRRGWHRDRAMKTLRTAREALSRAVRGGEPYARAERRTRASRRTQ